MLPRNFHRLNGAAVRLVDALHVICSPLVPAVWLRYPTYLSACPGPTVQLAAGGGYASGVPSPTSGGAPGGNGTAGSPTGASTDAHDDSTDQYRTVVPHTVKPRNQKGPFLRAAEAAFGCVTNGEFASNEIRTAKYTVRGTAVSAPPHNTKPRNCCPAITVLPYILFDCIFGGRFRCGPTGDTWPWPWQLVLLW